jgi:hypothetical protein
MAGGDHAGQQLMPAAEALEAFQGRGGGGMTGSWQQFALPKEHLPQLAGNAEHQVSILALDEPGFHALDEALSTQPATGGAQATLATERDDFHLAAGLAAQADETPGSGATDDHPFQRIACRLPDRDWQAPGKGEQGLAPVLSQDLL